MSKFKTFPTEHIFLREISERGHDLLVENCQPLEAPHTAFSHPEFSQLINRILTARQHHKPVILMMGAHPIKLGLSRFLIDLIEKKLITHLATNGASIIHDFELALVGGTSENVARWIERGQFGLWRETSRLNDIIAEGAELNEGLGEAVGRVITEQNFPHAEFSIAAAGYRCGVPVTSHVSIGSDIIHSHANCNGAALGKTSYTDFLIFARSIQDLEHGVRHSRFVPAAAERDAEQETPGGVYLNIGSAVTGPEVYLKALSMARNVAHQRGQQIKNFTTAVFDLVPLPENWRDGVPNKNNPFYYYRPWKTILERTTSDGGRHSRFVPAAAEGSVEDKSGDEIATEPSSYYFKGDHRQTIPSLWHELTTRMDEMP